MTAALSGSDSTGAMIEERVPLAGRELVVVRPPDAEALIDEDAFARNEFLPYWAELWPSARVLAAVVAELPLAGTRVVELGCGVGLPSLAAAVAGADVLATDWSEDALQFAGRNAELNGLHVRTERVDWSQPDALADAAPFDLVIAADVLYDARDVEPLLALLPRLTPEVLLADPARPYAKPFLEAAARTWNVEVEQASDAPRVTVYRLTLR